MEAREVSLLTENARLKKKNIVLAMKVEDLGLAVKNRGTVIKDAIAELDHDSIRWHGEIQRNGTAEEKVHEENETSRTRDKSRMTIRKIKGRQHRRSGLIRFYKQK
jgi:hypothetical protein